MRRPITGQNVAVPITAAVKTRMMLVQSSILLLSKLNKLGGDGLMEKLPAALITQISHSKKQHAININKAENITFGPKE